MNSKRSILLRRYELGHFLGQGTFAKVYYAKGLNSGESVAIKVIDKEKIMRVGLMDQIKREISVMRMVKHPNIIELYEVMATKSKIYLVMEYVKGGELFNKVTKGKPKERAMRQYFQQLVTAVDYCHSRGVYHRDLKPENLLLDDAGNLKVSDFGLSALVESKRQDGLLHTACGTPAYVAPEVLSGKGYDGSKADIWSCGVILYVLMAGYLPFTDPNLMEMYRKIGKGEFNCPDWFPSEISQLLQKILDPNPVNRISIAKIMVNPWFRKGLARRPRAIQPEIEPEPQTVGDADGIFDITDDIKQEDSVKPTNLNAFDIINMSAGFDISGLFEGEMVSRKCRKQAKFTSMESYSSIVSKLEDVAKKFKLKVKKKVGGAMKLEACKLGRKGALEIDAEIFEFATSFHLVEMTKSSGDTLEYQKLMKRHIRPALKDIVWAWQGEQQEQEQAKQQKQSK